MKTQVSSVLLAGLIALPLSDAGASAEQFFAKRDAGGNINVVDSSGAPVSIAYSNPVGTKPSPCPSGSDYFTEMDTDRTKLALTDCATDQGNYTLGIAGATN